MLIPIIGLTLALLIFLYFRNIRLQKHLNEINNTISFGDALRLTQLPIIPITIGEHVLNMILDTGSTVSYLDKNSLPKDFYGIQEGKSATFGLNGEAGSYDKTKVFFKCRDKELCTTFIIRDMKKSFDPIKEHTGVTVHGLLSSKFFDDNDALLDYKSQSFKLQAK